jgi:hypothetical protein
MSEGDEPTPRTRSEAHAAWLRKLSENRKVPEDLRAAAQPLDEVGQELDRLTRALQQRETELRALFNIVREAETGLSVHDVLDHVFKAFRELIPYDRIGCAFLSDDQQRVRAFWARSELGPVRLKPGYAQRMAGSSLQQVLDSGRPRVINDLEAYLESHPTSEATQLIVAEGGRSNLTCPLQAGDQPIGFLFFTSGCRSPSTRGWSTSGCSTRTAASPRSATTWPGCRRPMR